MIVTTTAAIRCGFLCGAAATALCVPGLAIAQASRPADTGGLDEIVVTAQRRTENQQDVPIAIAAVSAETLSSMGVSDTNTISQIVPSVNFQRSGASGLFFVRGVGTTNASVGDEGSNAFYVDGVYVPDLSGTVTQFNNIERVEVLKGPQGTLFGRNAFGGLIHIITKEPGDTFEASGEAGYANYNTMHGKLYAGGPIAGNVSADIALTAYDQGDGWGRNITLNRDIKKMKYWGARSKLVWRASDAFKVTLAGDYYDTHDNTAIGWSIDEDFPGRGFTGPVRSVGSMDTAAGEYSLTKLKSWGASATIEGDLGFATLTSISSFRDSKNRSDFDVDAGPLPWLHIKFDSGSKAYQQELRLASNDTDPFSWQLGAFYLRSEVFNKSRFSGLAVGGVAGGQFIDASLDTDSYAAFGEVAYMITPTTQLTGGIRYTKDKRKLDGGVHVVTNNVNGPLIPTPGKLSYGEVTYRVALRQDVTDNVNVYASFNRGFKAGTYSLQSPANAPVNPQFIDAYEVGVKSELFGRKLRLNAAAFHYDISGYQIRSAAIDVGAAVLLNAASVRVDGVDVEFEAEPVEGFRLFGGLTVLDSRFHKFGGPGARYQAPFLYPLPAVCDAPNTPDPGTSTGAPTGGFLTCFGDASGLQTPGAPDVNASLGSSMTWPTGDSGFVRMTMLASYNSGFPFESDGLLRQKAFAVANGSIAWWPNENWGVEVWGKNLTGTKYFQQKISTGLGATTARASPRTYGASLKFDF